jgi:DNA-binding NtrC family response regulator
METNPQLIGISAATRVVLEEIDYAARSDAKVLITGESGVGKEVVAQLIHQRSRRRQASLVTINCAGIPDSLLASELFGHMKGSFTDAYRDKQGWLEQAHRGTIFMDEIGEMSLSMQSLLLRFLENGEIQRVGSDRRTTAVDVRIIAATNRKLHERVAANEFREDLFYRLNVIHIEIPPLRDRREDIPPLLDHFLKCFGNLHGVERPRLSEEASAQLLAAGWPGNVRQLRNVVERLIVRARQNVISVGDLPREILSLGPTAPAAAEPKNTNGSRAAELFEKMVRDGHTFWSVVHDPFMSRDLTRDDIRSLVKQGLVLSKGSYEQMARLFNVGRDHRKLVNFLRKHHCHLPEQDLRAAPAHLDHHPQAKRAV